LLLRKKHLGQKSSKTFDRPAGQWFKRDCFFIEPVAKSLVLQLAGGDKLRQT
jgi:hypothetical protein